MVMMVGAEKLKIRDDKGGYLELSKKVGVQKK